MAFEYALSLNGEEISSKEWQELINTNKELVQFRGQWVQLDLDNMAKILDFWQSNTVENMDLLKLVEQASHPDIELDESTDEFIMSLYGKQNFDIYSAPKGFNGELRDYQKLGFSWLCYMEKLGLNPCLADDMGLGKTIQVIALLLIDKQETQEKEKQQSVLVVPTSVLGNWEKEIAKFGPSLSVFIYHSKATSQELEKVNTDVVLTTFTIIRRNYKIFKPINWHMSNHR